MAGCAARSYAPDDPRRTSELRIRAGDEIRVVTTSRERVSFRVERVFEDRFVGVTSAPHAKETLPAGLSIEVPYERLAMIEVVRFDTRGAALAGTVAVFTVALGTLLVTGVPVAVPVP